MTAATETDGATPDAAAPLEGTPSTPPTPPTRERAAPSASVVTHVQRARVARELADRALTPVEAIRAGSGASAAITLYREAAYWSLLALGAAPREDDDVAALLDAESARIDALAGGTKGPLGRAALARSFTARADEPAAQQEADADAARAVVASLLAAAEAPLRTAERAKMRVLARRGALLLGGMLVLLALVSLVRVIVAPKDLAAGKPWRASSAYDGFSPDLHECDGRATKILFHTKEEDSPWFEIDLGAATHFSGVDIRNRMDGFQARAIPLVVEVGDDAKHWREVARRTEPFSDWSAKFPAVDARYVRVRAAQKTWLHLERVAVRR